MKNRKLKGEPIALAYYSRHNLGGAGFLKTKIVSMSTIINRDFYSNLRKRGRTHHQIMRTIQPERLDQFTKDVQPIHNVLDLKPASLSKVSWWSKIKSKFNLLLTLSLLILTTPLLAQTQKRDVVSVVSEKKDTLFLAHNEVGLHIKDVWNNYYPDKPIIILKPEKWIINENTKRREKKTK